DRLFSLLAEKIVNNEKSPGVFCLKKKANALKQPFRRSIPWLALDSTKFTIHTTAPYPFNRINRQLGITDQRKIRQRQSIKISYRFPSGVNDNLITLHIGNAFYLSNIQFSI